MDLEPDLEGLVVCRFQRLVNGFSKAFVFLRLVVDATNPRAVARKKDVAILSDAEVRVHGSASVANSRDHPELEGDARPIAEAIS